MAAPRGSRAAGQRKMSLRAGGHIVAKGGHPNSYNLAAPNLHHNKAPGPEDGPRTSPEQPEAGGCELAHSRKSTGPEATSNYACVSRARREQQIALIWDTQGKHSWLKLSTTFDATESSPPWLAKALPRIFISLRMKILSLYESPDPPIPRHSIDGFIGKDSRRGFSTVQQL